MIGYLASRDQVDEMTFRQAILVGSACASFVVEDFSIRRTANLSPESLQARIYKLHDALRCDPVKL
jgi:hypothetical protein